VLRLKQFRKRQSQQDERPGPQQVLGILRVDVGDAPAVARHLDRLFQAGNLDLALELGQDGGRLLAEGLRRFRRADRKRPSMNE
jgi:hypothetical protein